jgi:hypothetical protein
MPAKKMRIELFDGEGNKYSVAFEGQISREKALRLLDLVELLGGTPSSVNQGVQSVAAERSKLDKVLLVAKKHFPLIWFSSKDVQISYEQVYKEPIVLSTVATYLGRLSTKGVLAKAGAGNRLKYRLASSLPEALVKQHIP